MINDTIQFCEKQGHKLSQLTQIQIRKDTLDYITLCQFCISEQQYYDKEKSVIILKLGGYPDYFERLQELLEIDQQEYQKIQNMNDIFDEYQLIGEQFIKQGYATTKQLNGFVSSLKLIKKQKKLQLQLQFVRLFGHEEEVGKIAITKDEQHISSVDSKSNLFVWKLESQQIIHKFKLKYKTPIDHTFSEDGWLLAASSFDLQQKKGCIEIYDLMNGFTICIDDDTTSQLQFTQNSQYLKSASKQSFKLWDINRQRIVYIKNFQDQITAVTLKSNQFYAYGDAFGMVYLYDNTITTDLIYLRKWNSLQKPIQIIEILDEKIVVCGKKKIIFWNITDIVKQKYQPLKVIDVLFRVDFQAIQMYQTLNSRFIFVSSNQKIQCWNYDLSNLIGEIVVPLKQMENHFVLSKDKLIIGERNMVNISVLDLNKNVNQNENQNENRYLIFSDLKSNIVIMDIKSQKVFKQISVMYSVNDPKKSLVNEQWNGHEYEVEKISMSIGGEYIASADVMGNIFVWDLQMKEIVRKFKLKNPAYFQLAFSECMKFLAASSLNPHQKEACVEVFNIINNERTSIIYFQSYTIHQLIFTPDSQFILVITNYQLYQCDISKQSYKILLGFANIQTAMSACKLCQYVLGDERGYINFGYNNGFRAHDDPIFNIEIVNNQTLITGAASEIRFWPLSDLNRHYHIFTKQIVLKNNFKIGTMKFNQQYPKLIIICQAQTIIIIDEQSGQVKKQIRPPYGLVTSNLIVTPDFKQIITGGQNKKVNIWNIDEQ